MKLYELLKKTKPDDVINEINHWYKGQERNEAGYRKVYDHLLGMIPGETESSFNIELLQETSETGEPWLTTHGVRDGEEISY